MRHYWRAILAAGLAVLLAYPAAGVIGGLVPRNGDWREPAAGIELFVESNGIHTGIVMPKVAAGVDWRGVFPARDLADPRYGGWGWVSVGWGERDFYRGTPTWSDLNVATVLHAALGSDATLVHVDHVPRPAPGADVRRLVVTPATYRRIAAYVMASMVPDGQRTRGYYGYDAFYEGRGRYSAVHTCNEWTGAALRRAGVRIGAWTPFPESVLRWFPQPNAAANARARSPTTAAASPAR